MKTLLPWICLAASASSMAFAKDGVDDYRQGDYFEAAEKLVQHKAPHPIIDYYLARMRLYGYGQLKNNVEAMKNFKQSAEKGFIPAIYVMGLYALLVDNQPEQAFAWFQKAALQNDVQAQMYCAAAYLFGVGVKKNTELAKKYYIPAARNGNAIAQVTLAEDFLDSRQAGNKKLGLLWLNKAVAQNNPEAEVRLGAMYAAGNLVEKDIEKARQLILAAVAQRYVPAWYQMGELALVNNDLKSAKEWFSKAAMEHYGPAEKALAELYLQPKSPFYDAHLGFLWMLKSAQNGYKDAELALSKMYQTGQGVEVDVEVAKEWQKKSTLEVKDAPQVALLQAARWLSSWKSDTFEGAGYHLKGIFNDWQNQDALKMNIYNPSPQMEVVSREALFKPNFEMMSPNDVSMSEYYNAFVSYQENASLQEALDFPRYPLDKSSEVHPEDLSSHGGSQIPKVGNKRDTPSATFSYLQGRAVLGDPMAQFTLGQMLEAGIGVEKNIPEAIKVYQLASAQQELRSEYNLGMIYLEGRGVPEDIEKAMTLLRDAAFKGNDHAQYALARIHELGFQNASGTMVIHPAREEALVMYDLASANDYGLAKYRLAEMLVREKKMDLSVQAKRHQRQLVKELYEGAYQDGVLEAALPLAFYSAMSKNPTKQAQTVAVAKEGAEKGNKAACLLLGLLYDRGIGMASDPHLAIQWLEKAASNPVAKFILGTDYGQGVGVGKDEAKGKAFLQDSANGGFSFAYLNLAVLKHSLGEPFLPELEKASALGNSRAGLLLADYYLSISGDEAHLKQSRAIYSALAEKGDKDAELKLGYMSEKGLGGNVDTKGAERWYQASAEQGQVVARFLLGQLYQMGKLADVPDISLAKKWYSAASPTFAPAAVALGFMDETVDDDYQQAQSHYQHAFDLNSSVGAYDLGLIYEKGKGRPVDFEKARKLYEVGMNSGDTKSMVQLAGFYFKGLGVSRDEDKALSLYQKAAAEGDREALYQLGLLSETGVTAAQNVADAIRYYQAAAEKGNAKAMLALARIYQYGLGVPKNLVLAEKYYQTLSNSGNAYAQYQLATFYYQGMNGERKPGLGKLWLEQAKANGCQEASQMLQWLDAQAVGHASFIMPFVMKQTVKDNRPVELMYLDALNEWNRGDLGSSKILFDKIKSQFPDFMPAIRASDQLNQLMQPKIFG